MIPAPESNETEDPTEVVQPVPGSTSLPSKPVSLAVGLDIAARTHPGNDGDINEDHYLVVRISRSLEPLLTNLPEDLFPNKLDEIGYGMLIADGLGGMPAGDIASAQALCKLVELGLDTPDWITKMSRRKVAVVMRRMTECFRRIDKDLRKSTENDRSRAGMSTTLTVACSLGTNLFLTYVGDSRAYLLRGDELHQLTRDHTLSEAMIEAGVGKADNDMVYGMRRVLTSALGAPNLRVDPRGQYLELRDGDQLLLCTDGLIESIDEEAIESVLRNSISADEACLSLIETAKASEDNMTVILARYHFPSTD